MNLPPETAAWLPILALPLIGAFIGYITNTIAIRMLFRPLRAWRLLGLRVPLTPGIIPGKRKELAQKIGQMVGHHLLTSDDVGRALQKTAFQQELQAALAERLQAIIDRDLGPLRSIIPTEFTARFDDLLRLLRLKLVDALFDFLNSNRFEQQLEGWLSPYRDQWLQRDLQSLLTEEGLPKLQQQIDLQVRKVLQSRPVAEGTERLVDAWLGRLLASDKSLRELLPQDLIELLLSQLEKELPPLLDKFGGLLHDPDFRRKLTRRIKGGLERFLDSLEGLTAIISAFVDMKEIHARIPGFIDKAGEELAGWLKEEKTQQQIAALIRTRVDRWLDRPIHSFVDHLPYEKVDGVRAFVRQKAVETIQGPRTAETVIGLLDRGVLQIKDRPFGELLSQALPDGQLDRWWAEAVQRLLGQIRSDAARQAVDRLLAEWAHQRLEQTAIGPISARLPDGVRQELEHWLYGQLTELLRKEVPPLVEALNVERLVEEKVNGLDVLQVEELLLGIMKEQFKYINLFGGLLGFLIGCLNLLITRL